MAILIGDIEKGWIYRTPKNQERLVLGWDKDDKVVYSSRGGNVMNEFNTRTKSSEESFSEACSEKLRQVSDIESLIESNNARDVVVR